MPTLSIHWVLTISSMDKALSLCEREGRKEVCFYAQSIWTHVGALCAQPCQRKFTELFC